ncbi:MAG: CPBP family intramembrane metalloprotease [Myxococcales bacterium]|nr:CPBP family intramembrane metalloprotease [Myxococcales bacterium]
MPKVPEASAHSPSPRHAVIEVVLGTCAAGAGLAIIEALSRVLPVFAPWAGAAVAGVFIGLPLLLAHFRPFEGDPLGIGQVPLVPSLLLGLAATAIIALPFILGYDILATRVLQQTRFAGPGVLSFGQAYQRTSPLLAGHVSLSEEGHKLAIDNRTAATIVVRAGAERFELRPTRRLLVSEAQARHMKLTRPDGRALPSGVVIAAGDGAAQDAPTLDLRRSRLWLFWLLASQFLVIALPEEIFFRGWVLGRLRVALPARRRLLGVPFGSAHVLSAALFALIHLVAVPSAHRLLVFFPGLLFAWLTERSRSVIAPAVNHTLSNVLLNVVSRVYR